MAKRSRSFGNYAIRAVGHKDKAKWVVEIAKTATEAKKVAKKLARSKLGPYAPEVCIFDLSRFERRPVCLRESRTKSRYARNKIVVARPGGMWKRVRREPGMARAW